MNRVAHPSLALVPLLLAVNACHPRPPPEQMAAQVPPRLDLRGPGGARYFYLEPGTSVELSAILTGGSGGSGPADRVAFRSRDPRIATVDPAGVLTARTEGTVWIVGEAQASRSVVADSI